MNNVVADSLELTNIINVLSKNGNRATFDDLKNYILQNPKIGIKENDELAIIYTDSNTIEQTDKQSKKYSKSTIIEKESLKIIGSQYNPIVYNHDAFNAISNMHWNNIVIYKCYEGTTFLVYYHNDKWYISTRRCLNSEGKFDYSGQTFRDIFIETMKDKFSFDDLNINYCYHFVLIHHKIKGIVKYSCDNNNYKYIYCILVTKKYTLNEVNVSVPGTLYVKKEQFPNINSLMKHIGNINREDCKNKRVSTEGYILKHYKGEIHKSPFVIYKLQTYIYQKLSKLLPNNNNLNQCYLELYQTNKLKDILPYFTNYSFDIMQRINNSFKTISKELLDLYHLTRNNKNPDMYQLLPGIYKHVLYKIHGIYIKNRTDDFKDGSDSNKNKAKSKAITKYNIYDMLKSLEPQKLRHIFYQRMVLCNTIPRPVYISKCSYTSTHTVLMFGNVFTS